MRILIITFYFTPDLSAGSFRNTALVNALRKYMDSNDEIDVITTMPNRYSSYKTEANSYENHGNTQIYRVKIPPHRSGYLDQINSFKAFYQGALKLVKGKKYDIVYASSSRLFSAFLGARIARKKNSFLYLDIRDIFTDTINDVLKNNSLKGFINPILGNVEQYTISSANYLNLVSKGFESYFRDIYKGPISFYTNGIDDDFLNFNYLEKVSYNPRKVITYAGNIGEGQGLDKIIPEAAIKLNDRYHFKIIGDGGARNKLASKLKRLNVQNVELCNPVKRRELLDIYSQSDYLFLHLNNYPAFHKVLPSKIFDYAATPLPIIAGVNGYARKFIQENVSNALVFDPVNADEFVQKISDFNPEYKIRENFIEKYRRSTIMDEMAQSILQLNMERSFATYFNKKKRSIKIRKAFSMQKS